MKEKKDMTIVDVAAWIFVMIALMVFAFIAFMVLDFVTGYRL